MTATGSIVQSMTGVNDVDGLLSGVKWNSLSIDFNFPTSAAYYPANYTPVNQPAGFIAVSKSFKSMVRSALDQFAQVTNLTFNEVGPSTPSNISAARTTNFSGVAGNGYGPGSFPAAGDVWFSPAVGDVEIRGRGSFLVVMHELGHAVGLKHPHDPGAAVMSSAHDFNDYTVMSYRKYEGAPMGWTSEETFGNPQTLMMYDILAVQTMYGADYKTRDGNNTYTWDPQTGQMSIDGVGQWVPGANRIYMTLWDGGGYDTYNLSNYTTDVTIDLNPGGRSIFSDAQLAIVDTPTNRKATGNVFNALLFNNDPSSMIEKAIGGSGNDTLVGNAVNHVLVGKAGNDTLIIGTGYATLEGGPDTDTADFSRWEVAVLADLHFKAWTRDSKDLASGTWRPIADIVEVENVIGTIYHDALRGRENDNVLTGGAGNDILTGFGGADRFDYNVITDGLDTITDFALGTDQLDFRDVLKGYDPATSNIASFIELSGGTATTVSVNADGLGNDFVPLATLSGVAMTSTLLGDMVAQGSLLLA